jgi:hypothetical protein
MKPEPNIVETGKAVLSGVAALLVVALFAGTGITSMKVMPDYAPVYLDDASKTYFAAPCVLEWERPDINANALRLSTANEARSLKYKPDHTCRNTGIMAIEDRSLTGQLFERIGLLAPNTPWWDNQDYY